MNTGDFETQNTDPAVNTTLISPGGIPLASGALKGLRYMVDSVRRLWTIGTVLIAPAYNHQIQDGYAIDNSAGLSQALCVQKAFMHYYGGTWAPGVDIGSYGYRANSAVHAALTTTRDSYNLKSGLDIVAVCSAGTTTLKLEVSVDNSNFIEIDTTAAAGTCVLHYDPTTKGATNAINPLPFRWYKITTSDAGVGNTVTLTFARK